jgi:integrase/recombinase XerC
MKKSIDEFARHLTAERNLSPLTVKSYRTALESAHAFFTRVLGSGFGVAQLTSRHVRAYVANCSEQKKSRATIGQHITVLRTWFTWLCRVEIITVNPADGIRSMGVEKVLPHFLSKKEIDRLLAAPVGKDIAAVRDRAILETLYSGGLRVAELVGLNRDDVDLAGGTAIVMGKGSRERVALLGECAVDALRAWCKRRRMLAKRGPALFITLAASGWVAAGGRLTTRSIGRMVDKYVMLTGLDSRTSPHTIRHSYATHLLDAGADIRAVQELLGHKAITSTQVYCHVSTQRLQASYRGGAPTSLAPECDRRALYAPRSATSAWAGRRQVTL